MRFGLKLARYGMNMEEATISRWHKAPGDHFETGDILYEIETEKVSQEVEAVSAGTLCEIVIAQGDMAAVGAIVCFVDGALPARN